MYVNLKVHDLSFTYQSLPVLSGVNFEVKKGDVLGIIGPNGSGKSTLLKNINALLKPLKGSVMLEGDNIFKMSRQKIAQSMAVVPQDTSIGFNFSVYEAVMMGRVPHLGRFQKEGEDDRTVVKESMEVTNCWSFKDRSVMELSGGERQRVILARALAQEPEIILLDEPTAFLDISYQTEIFDLIKELNIGKNLTVIAVLHDLNLAAQYCDHLILLNKGEIYKIGTPDEVITVDNIQEVYGTKVIISKHPVSKTPYVSLLPKIQDKFVKAISRKIHIIGGGGSASSLMEELFFQGMQLTAGVLNVGDKDWETAKNLGIDCTEELPFSFLSGEKHGENLEMIKNSDSVILTNTPFGRGNLKNLEAALFAVEKNFPVYIYEGFDVRLRDYTGGEAADIFQKLKDKGAREIANKSELLAIIKDKND